MGSAITINPAELETAATKIGDRMQAGNSAGTALTGLDLGVEMPPGVAGKVKGLVDQATSTIVKANAAMGSLSEELLVRAGKAERADQISKAFGGLTQAAGITASSLEMGGDAAFGASKLPAGALSWAKRAGKGLMIVDAMAAGLTSWQKHKDNPFMTGAQKREQVAGETGASLMKMAAGMAAAGAVAGSIVPGAGTAAGAAAGFLGALAVGITAGATMEVLDKAFGLTGKVVDAVDWTSARAVDAYDWTKGAAGDAARWTGNAGKDAYEWGGGALDDSRDWLGTAGGDAYDWGNQAKDDAGRWLGNAGKDVSSTVSKAPGAIKDGITGSPGAVKDFFEGLG